MGRPCVYSLTAASLPFRDMGRAAATTRLPSALAPWAPFGITEGPGTRQPRDRARDSTALASQTEMRTGPQGCSENVSSPGSAVCLGVRCAPARNL